MNNVNNNSVLLGKDVEIGDNCVFDKMKSDSNQGLIKFGDYSRIHENCQFYVSGEEFVTGDYCTIHKNTYLNGYKSCHIGHNSWIGQNSIINSTDELKIGNNCGIGAYSKIWTHAAWGDAVEGCKLLVGMPDMECKSGAVTIGDDFWGVGQITVSPGVKIGNKVIALTNSLITKDIPDNTIIAGIPAKPIVVDGDVQAYKKLNSSEKYKLMKKFTSDFSKMKNIQIEFDDNLKIISLENKQLIINCSDNIIDEKNDSTFFDVIKRTYTKKHKKIEIDFMRFVLDYKIGFVPK
jgi:acetyltransferase-like isoleucine patch superfamily enzyme